MKKEFWEALSPDDAQSQRLLQCIHEKAEEASHVRRPLRIAAVIAAILVITTVAGVVAAPAMIRYYVPHLGMVEVPETTETRKTAPYLFLQSSVSQKSGNHYRMGYMYGDTAYVYIYTPLTEEYLDAIEAMTPDPAPQMIEKLTATIEHYKEKMNALENDFLRVEEITSTVCNESTNWERMAEYRLTFTGLDETAAENGIPFMGDTIRFETPNIEYAVYTQEHNGITLSLIPLADDYSVFTYTLETDETVPGTASLVYDERWMTAGYSSPFFVFVDADGHRFKAQMADNIIYLENRSCDAPLVQLYAGRLDFALAMDPVTFTLEMPAVGERTEKELALPFGDVLGNPTVKASLSYNTAEKNDGTWREHMNTNYPSGTLTLRIADMISADGTVTYRVQTPMIGGAYGEALHQAQAAGQRIIVNTAESFRTVPYVECDLTETECSFSRLHARYHCDWSFTFD